MTYTALAKSLGISLRRISSLSSSTSPNAPTSPASAPAFAPPPTSAPTITPSPSRHVSSEELVSKVSAPDTRNGGVDSQSNSQLLLRPDAVPSGDTKENIDKKLYNVPGSTGAVTLEDAGSDIDAEEIPDSDIDSSRPPSPHAAFKQGNSQRKKTSEPAESQSMQLTSLFQSSDVDQEEELLENRSGLRTTRRESMSDEDLHQAKLLVLDLLGWGVPPEYLLQRGISHSLLYTVFTDLRLRLPDTILEDCFKLVSAQS